MEEETREFVMDYLNGHNSEEELALKFDLKEAEDYMAKYKGTNRELYENWKFAYETDKNILQFIYEIKGDK